MLQCLCCIISLISWLFKLLIRNLSETNLSKTLSETKSGSDSALGVMFSVSFQKISYFSFVFSNVFDIKLNQWGKKYIFLKLLLWDKWVNALEGLFLPFWLMYCGWLQVFNCFQPTPNEYWWYAHIWWLGSRVLFSLFSTNFCSSRLCE